MTNQQLDEEAIFHVARKIADAEARRNYLDQVCANDPALRQRIEALLSVHEQEEGVLESADGTPPTVDHPVAEGPGTVIGRYKLLQKIGQGGFGIVYMADQREPMRRKVALTTAIFSFEPSVLTSVDPLVHAG